MWRYKYRLQLSAWKLQVFVMLSHTVTLRHVVICRGNSTSSRLSWLCRYVLSVCEIVLLRTGRQPIPGTLACRVRARNGPAWEYKMAALIIAKSTFMTLWVQIGKACGCLTGQHLAAFSTRCVSQITVAFTGCNETGVWGGLARRNGHVIWRRFPNCGPRPSGGGRVVCMRDILWTKYGRKVKYMFW
jgi:hypothetical protein